MMDSLEAKGQEKQTRDLRNLGTRAAGQGFSWGDVTVKKRKYEH